LGVDIGKSEFHAALLIDDRVRSKSFSNNTKGFAQLNTWLRNREVAFVHACMEATGGFSEALALHLHEAGHKVSIVNPARVKAFAQSELLRTKNDAVDAALIARFCRAHQPVAWKPLAPEIRALQALVRRYAGLKEMHQQEANRLGVPDLPEAVRRSLLDLSLIHI